MESSRHLTKASAGDDTDPRLLQQVEGVEDISSLARLLCCLNCLEQNNRSQLQMNFERNKVGTFSGSKI